MNTFAVLADELLAKKVKGGKAEVTIGKLRELANERRRFGYRRLAIMLKREWLSMNLKKVYRP